MFLKKKKRVLETVETICEVIEYINNSGKVEMLEDVKNAISSILEQIEKEDYDILETINYIKIALSNVGNLLAKEEITFDDLNDLIKQVSVFEQSFLIQVQVKLNVVFMPYNITMWDSLESIYLACKDDEDCVARVVPIPYFDISQDPPVRHYDFDKYDKNIDLIKYDEFNLGAEEPDIIYVHNIYDDGNTLTSVLPEFYTRNLKKYTDMLVYSPYCVPNFLKQYSSNKHSYTFDLYGANNVDRFVCAGDFVKKEGLKSNIPDEKILNLGTPKFDSLIQHINDDFDCENEWLLQANGRRIVLFSTSINYFLTNLGSDNRITNFCDVLCKFSSILQKFKDEDIFVIWRPHPLTRNFIKKVHPHFVDWYDSLVNKINGIGLLPHNLKQYDNVVLDENSSYLPAFKASDALVLDYSSIMFPYLLLNKKLISIYSSSFFEQEIDVNEYKDKLGFVRNDEFEDINEFVNFDKKSEIQIDDKLLSNFYKNLDGSAGEKIHYAVKNDVMKNN